MASDPHPKDGELSIRDCPFCAAQPDCIPWHGGPPTKILIACTNETCEVQPQVSGPTLYTAISRWNRRAPTPTPPPKAVAPVDLLRVVYAVEAEWAKSNGTVFGENGRGEEVLFLNSVTDPHALPALRAYAVSCQRSNPELATAIGDILLTRLTATDTR